MELKEIAEILDGKLVGENVKVTGFTIPKFASENDLSFLRRDEDIAILKKSKCNNFIIYNRLFLPKNKNFIVINDEPIMILQKVLNLFNTIPPMLINVSESAKISKNVYLGKNIIIGDNAIIEDNVKIYDNVKIGKNVHLYSGSVIGKPGFLHYLFSENIISIRGIGGVIIEDNVEIGANTCIDSGIFGQTIIGANTKIDNLCQIGHDVKIGTNTIICSQVGIAGYTKIGNNSLFYGKVGVKDNLILGDNIIAKAYSCITKCFKSNSVISGIPARDEKNLKKLLYKKRGEK